MFGKQTVASPIGTIPVVSNIDPEYSSLCDAIGLKSPALDMENLLGWMAARGHRMYDQAQVAHFLARQYPDKTIVWLPLRKSDDTCCCWSFTAGEDRIYCRGNIYTKSIPITVLRIVSEIESVFPGIWSFHASDYEANIERPDPFLRATHKLSPKINAVIFHWDEPSFK